MSSPAPTGIPVGDSQELIDLLIRLIPYFSVLICVLIGLIFYVNSARKPKSPPTVLDRNAKVIDYKEYALIEKIFLTHDTRLFRFELPPGHSLGLPIGQHVTLKFTNSEGKVVQRSYTPVSDESELGSVSLVIKVYKAGVHPKFPDGGQMSQHLDSLKLGDKILMKGPKGHMEYLGKGKYTTKPLGKPFEKRTCDSIGMIAGGTGITPCLQILKAILKEGANDKTPVKLLYANITEKDILCREELEAMQEKHPEQFQVHYTLDQPSASWKYSNGFVNREMIESHLIFPPVNGKKRNQHIFMCGPPPMLKFACIPNLKELGFTEKEWNQF